jgi:hypothetical protein
LDEEKMNKEFKKISGKSETRYILEDASAGGTSAGAIASVPNTLGTLQKRLEELKKSVTVPKKSPRNPVGMGATPGRGTQKHVRSNRKSEKDNKKVFEEEEKQKFFIKFTTEELPDEQSTLVAYGGFSDSYENFDERDIEIEPFSIDENDIDYTLEEINQKIAKNGIKNIEKIYFLIPKSLSGPLRNLIDHTQEMEDVEIYTVPDEIDNGTRSKKFVFDPETGKRERIDKDLTSRKFNPDSEDKVELTLKEPGLNYIKPLYSGGELDRDTILSGNKLIISRKTYNELKNRMEKDTTIAEILSIKGFKHYFTFKMLEENIDEPDHEISMASSELKSIIEDANEILEIIEDIGESEGLEAWQQSKITKAADFLTSVVRSLKGDQDSEIEITESLKKKFEESLDEDLKKWFKEKWVRFGPDGEIRGQCARGSESEGKPKCLPQSKAQALGKKGRASAASRKRREDPNPERKGKAINVATKKKSNESVEESTKCPHCGGPMFEETMMMEKKDACYYKVKSRYKVWPSAYASGALVKCRKKGSKNWGSKSKE